jgi:preprotein translocase subunit SecD
MSNKAKSSQKSNKKSLRADLEGKLTETLKLFTEKAGDKKYKKTIKKAGKSLTAKILKDRSVKARTKKISIKTRKTEPAPAAVSEG